MRSMLLTRTNGILTPSPRATLQILRIDGEDPVSLEIPLSRQRSSFNQISDVFFEVHDPITHVHRWMPSLG